MDEFKELYNKIEDIKKAVDEKERLQAERQEVTEKTKSFASSIIAKYQEAEAEASRKIIEAGRQNDEYKAELRKLTRAKAEAEARGEAFQDDKRIKELKGELSSYEITVEVLEDMKQAVVLSAADLQQLDQYRAKAIEIINHISFIENRLLEALTELRGAEVMRCLATLEPIPGRSDFLPEVFETIGNMRKGEMEQ